MYSSPHYAYVVYILLWLGSAKHNCKRKIENKKNTNQAKRKLYPSLLPHRRHIKIVLAMRVASPGCTHTSMLRLHLYSLATCKSTLQSYSFNVASRYKPNIRQCFYSSCRWSILGNSFIMSSIPCNVEVNITVFSGQHRQCPIRFLLLRYFAVWQRVSVELGNVTVAWKCKIVLCHARLSSHLLPVLPVPTLPDLHLPASSASW